MLLVNLINLHLLTIFTLDISWYAKVTVIKWEVHIVNMFQGCYGKRKRNRNKVSLTFEQGGMPCLVDSLGGRLFSDEEQWSWRRWEVWGL